MNRRGAGKPFDEAKPQGVTDRGREREEAGEPPARSCTSVVLGKRGPHPLAKSATKVSRIESQDPVEQDLFTMRSDGTALSRLTDDLAREWEPRFTPDGTALVFSSTKSGTYDAWSIRLDGSGRTRLTAITDSEVAHTMFAPDGRRLFAVLLTGDIVIGSAPWPITRQSATVIMPQRVGGGTLVPRYWSRDGRWLAGPVVMPSGELRGNALYDVAVGTVRQLSDDAASGDMAWMPGATRVIYFAKSGKLVIQNIATLARHDIPVTLPLPPDDVWSIAAATDGRTLCYGAQQMEANIWKVERASPRIRKP